MIQTHRVVHTATMQLHDLMVMVPLVSLPQASSHLVFVTTWLKLDCELPGAGIFFAYVSAQCPAQGVLWALRHSKINNHPNDREWLLHTYNI